MTDIGDEVLHEVVRCANSAAGTSLTLPPGGDIMLDEFNFDSLGLFAFLLELERRCGLAFDENLLDPDQLRSIRSAAALVVRSTSTG